jgi:ATP synthase protein I
MMKFREVGGQRSDFHRRSMFFSFKNNRSWAENIAIVMQIGLTMAGCIVFCFFVGLYLDKWLGTKGIFVAVFTVLGVIGGGVTVFRQIIEIVNIKPGDKKDSEEQ